MEKGIGSQTECSADRCGASSPAALAGRSPPLLSSLAEWATSPTRSNTQSSNVQSACRSHAASIRGLQSMVGRHREAQGQMTSSHSSVGLHGPLPIHQMARHETHWRQKKGIDERSRRSGGLMPQAAPA